MENIEIFYFIKKENKILLKKYFAETLKTYYYEIEETFEVSEYFNSEEVDFDSFYTKSQFLKFYVINIINNMVIFLKNKKSIFIKNQIYKKIDNHLDNIFYSW
jgi:hypothetical protein